MGTFNGRGGDFNVLMFEGSQGWRIEADQRKAGRLTLNEIGEIVSPPIANNP
jgi:hypothetical protein